MKVNVATLKFLSSEEFDDIIFKGFAAARRGPFVPAIGKTILSRSAPLVPCAMKENFWSAELAALKQSSLFSRISFRGSAAIEGE